MVKILLEWDTVAAAVAMASVHTHCDRRPPCETVTRYLSLNDMAVASVWIPPTDPTTCLDLAGKESSWVSGASMVDWVSRGSGVGE